MPRSTSPELVQLSGTGQASIPEDLIEEVGIETPCEVFVYAADGPLIVEPVLSLEDLHGIHAGNSESGGVLSTVADLYAEERRHRDARVERSVERHDG